AQHSPQYASVINSSKTFRGNKETLSNNPEVREEVIYYIQSNRPSERHPLGSYTNHQCFSERISRPNKVNGLLSILVSRRPRAANRRTILPKNDSSWTSIRK